MPNKNATDAAKNILLSDKRPPQRICIINHHRQKSDMNATDAAKNILIYDKRPPQRLYIHNHHITQRLTRMPRMQLGIYCFLSKDLLNAFIFTTTIEHNG